MPANDFINNTLLSSNTSDYTLITQILNIYRYGSLDVPEDFVDHIRDTKPEYTVQFSALEFMTTGPGRYVRAADFDSLQMVFDGSLGSPSDLLGQLQTLLSLPSQTSFSMSELIESGLFNRGDFLKAIKQTSIDTGSDDYAVRAFIFQSQQFEIRDTLTLDLSNNEFEFRNVEVFPTEDGDNFDFNTTNGMVQIADQYFLEPFFDPSGLGELNDIDVPILFEYNGQGRLYGSYKVGDYSAEEISAPSTVPFIAGIGIFAFDILGTISDLESLGVITYDSAGRYLVYGSNEADNLSQATLPDLTPNPAHMVGGDGIDNLTGSAYDDMLEGNDGDDILKGTGGEDILIGGLGADTLKGGIGADYLYGHLIGEGDSNDPNPNGPADDNAVDTLEGGNGADHLFGGGGGDILKGGNGNDWIYGHSLFGFDDDGASDILEGGDGNDKLYGQKGNDVLSGGADNDKLYGGNGKDTLEGGSGEDKLFGGNGFDTATYANSGSGVTISSADDSGLFSMMGGGGDAEGDVLKSIERIIGSDHNDKLVLTGWYGYGEYEFLGGSGQDELYLQGPYFGVFVGGEDADKVYASWRPDSLAPSSSWTALGSGVTQWESSISHDVLVDNSDKTEDRFYLGDFELSFNFSVADYEAGQGGEYLFYFYDDEADEVGIDYIGTIDSSGVFHPDDYGDYKVLIGLTAAYDDAYSSGVRDLYVTVRENTHSNPETFASFKILGFEQGDYGISFDIPELAPLQQQGSQLATMESFDFSSIMSIAHNTAADEFAQQEWIGNMDIERDEFQTKPDADVAPNIDFEHSLAFIQAHEMSDHGVWL